MSRQIVSFAAGWIRTFRQPNFVRSVYRSCGKVLPAKKTATLFQLDRRISMMIDVEFTSRLPLMQSQE